MKVGEDSVVMMLVEPVERLKTITGGINLVALTSRAVGTWTAGGTTRLSG
jgi:hypothetical protein